MLLLLVQSINCVSALSELSEPSFTVTRMIVIRVLNHRYVVKVAVDVQVVQEQVEEMRSTHTTLCCSFIGHHPITHRSVVNQPLLSVRQEANTNTN